MSETSDWYVYVLRCDDDSLYTGITTDLERRVREHNESADGARYTRSRRPVELVAAWPRADRSAAASLEARFKSLSRAEKVARVEVGARPAELEAAAEAYRDAFAVDGVSREDFRPVPPMGDDGGAFESARRMSEAVESIRGRLVDGTASLESPAEEPLFFEGPGLFDGHALEVGGTTRVFFDVELLASHFAESGFEPRVHAAHEWVHAVHYGNRPAFYPGRSKSPSEEVWHRMVAEGLATIGSEQLVGCPPEVSSWFGLLGSDEVDTWRARAEERRDAVGEAIFALEESVRMGGELWDELFRSLGAAEESRLGYWYGRQIVERAREEVGGFGELLAMPPGEWEERVDAYFGRDS
ncbi:MAG: GIY-YIG nuclease family protein [Bradymonadaceae bacterium]